MKRLLLAICMLMLAGLACRKSDNGGATPTVLASPTAERIVLALGGETNAPIVRTPTLYQSVGVVVADESLHVRETHDFGVGESNVVGYLYHGDKVGALECWQSDDGIVWVRHDMGWSVVSSGGEVYIDGVCLNP